MRAKKYDEAIASLTAAQQIKADPRVESLLADAKQKQQVEMNRRTSFDTAMKAGQAAMTARNYDEAIRQLRSALLLQDDPQATAMLTQAQKAKDEAAAMAAKGATEAAAQAAMAQKQQALTAAVRAGQAAFAAKNYPKAIEQFEAARVLAPTNPDVAALLKQANDARTAAMTPPPVVPKKELPPVVPPIVPKKELPPVVPPIVPPVMPQKELPPVAPPVVVPKKELPPVVPPVVPPVMPKKELPPVVPKPKDPIPPVVPKAKDPVPVVPKAKDPAPKKDNPEERAAALTQAGLQAEAKADYAAAAGSFAEALKLAPTNAGLKRKVDFNRAMVDGLRDLQAGKFAGAVLSLDQAVRLDPNNADAKAQLAKARAGKKQ